MFYSTMDVGYNGIDHFYKAPPPIRVLICIYIFDAEKPFRLFKNIITHKIDIHNHL